MASIKTILDEMQKELHTYLARHGLPHAEPGDVVAVGPCGTSFQAVLHAVSIDAFYYSSADLVCRTVQRALAMAGGLSARRVALVALATGYGPMTMPEFGRSIKPLLPIEVPPLEEVVICVLKDYEVAELKAALAGEP